MSIPIRAIPTGAEHAPPAAHYEAPYRWFIAASLTLAIGGGFLLGALVALQRAMEWDWDYRSVASAQAHGQLQLVGFGGLFTIGMALRLMPRFSTRPLAYRALVAPMLALIAGSLAVRAIAQVALRPGGARDALLIATAIALLAGALVFAAIVWRTLVHPDSKGEATSYFFCAGSLGFVAAAALNLAIVVEMSRDGLAAAPFAKQFPLVFLEQYGFTLTFLGGVALRAVPTFTGRDRPNVPARIVAVMLAAGVATFATAQLWGAYDAPTAASMRIASAGLLLAAAAFACIAWMSGVFHPRANRVAAASQAPFWFVRSAMTWLLVAAALSAWYATPTLIDGRVPDAFAIDAVRHVLAVGVLSMMVFGMAMMIVPEFAGRRLQHPAEGALIVAMVVAMNVAVALRVWPSAVGPEWVEHTRWWPMAIAGALTETVAIVFAGMFAQSYFEQRTPGWATPAALRERRGGAARRPGKAESAT